MVPVIWFSEPAHPAPIGVRPSETAGWMLCDKNGLAGADRMSLLTDIEVIARIQMIAAPGREAPPMHS
jgi:hypothetical protein